MLQDIGHNVEFAEDGEEMVRMHEANTYDIILSDVRMPNLSGPEATRHIRRGESDRADIPIIALTADVIEENKQSYLKAGMNAIVAKPIVISELVRAIDELLGETLHEEVKRQPN